MKVGLDQGESIPFAQRGLYTQTNNQDNASNLTSGGDLIIELLHFFIFCDTNDLFIKM